MHISEGKRCLNVKSSPYYFHMKMNILTDFEIFISVPYKEYRCLEKVIQQMGRMWMAAPFSKLYGKN